MKAGLNTTIEYMGTILTIREWAAKLDLHPSTLTSRINRGMKVEEAFTSPIRANSFKAHKLLHAFGTDRSVSEWAALSGVPASTIRGGLKRGLSLEDIINRGRVRRKRNDAGKTQKPSQPSNPPIESQNCTLLITYKEGRVVQVAIPEGEVVKIEMAATHVLFGG